MACAAWHALESIKFEFKHLQTNLYTFIRQTSGAHNVVQTQWLCKTAGSISNIV